MASDGDQKKPWVEYNWLSDNCGTKVSNICLGAGTFGKGKPDTTFNSAGNLDEAASFEILDRYVELGGNFVDTANVYGDGDSESIIGSWINSRNCRGRIFLATKVFFGSEFSPDASHPNGLGLSRGSIMHNIEESLKRLQTDYIDLYYSHWWDEGTNLEEKLRTFNDLVRSGKVRYVGLSNVTGSNLQKVMAYNHFMGFDPCVVLQQEYNLLERSSDIEVVPTCRSEGVGLLPYSPLKSGLLSGKFKRDAKAASLAGTRLGWVAEKPKERAFHCAPDIETMRGNEDFWKLMDSVESIAKQHEKSAAQVSLRWLLQKDFIPSVIIGAKTIKQLEENMAAGTGWKLTDEQMKELNNRSSFASPIPQYPYKVINGLNEQLQRIRRQRQS